MAYYFHPAAVSHVVLGDRARVCAMWHAMCRGLVTLFCPCLLPMMLLMVVEEVSHSLMDQSIECNASR